VTYEMLAGRPPFEADSPVALATKHMSEEPEPLSRVNPAVPRALEAVVARAMRKDPAERYQDAREMAADLGRAVTGEHPVAAAGAITQPVPPRGGDTRLLPAALPEPVRESFRRSPWLPAALIGVLLTLLAIVAVVVLLSDRTGEPRRGRSGPTTPADSPSPSPSPSPEEPPTVNEAFAALSTVLNEGYANEKISDGAFEELLRDGREVVEKYRGGDLEGALQELDELRETIDGFRDEREIRGAGRARALHEAADLIEEAMMASPPPESSGDGDGDDD
jgi:hypothetical protein